MQSLENASPIDFLKKGLQKPFLEKPEPSGIKRQELLWQKAEGDKKQQPGPKGPGCDRKAIAFRASPQETSLISEAEGNSSFYLAHVQNVYFYFLA